MRWSQSLRGGSRAACGASGLSRTDVRTAPAEADGDDLLEERRQSLFAAVEDVKGEEETVEEVPAEDAPD